MITYLDFSIKKLSYNMFVGKYKFYGGGSTQAVDNNENKIFKLPSKGGSNYIEYENRLDRTILSITNNSIMEYF